MSAPWAELAPAVWLTLRLAASAVAILLALCLPLAWWLATTRSRWRAPVEALTTLPVVLPATVLGFYLLVAFAPTAPLGGAFLRVTGTTLTFSFWGLLLASVVHSLPFVIGPLRAAFAAVGPELREAAATLGARPWDVFRSVALPLSSRGVLTAAVLGFAHSLGEFGVILMVGGNIPGETRTVAIEIYNAVETLDYRTAHVLSAGLLGLTFASLLAVEIWGRRTWR